MAQRTVTGPVSLRLPSQIAIDLKSHLFSGDESEHGAVIGAAVLETQRGFRLLGRHLYLAIDGKDYVPSHRGHRMLTADFVRRCALSCADEGLAYLAVHNHGGTDRVDFSSIDMASHRRGYPAILDILDGPPAGGLVFARQAVAGDIWISAEGQVKLDQVAIVGACQQLLFPSPRSAGAASSQYDRQVRLFGERGQEVLTNQKVAIIGAGGAGSLINEYLARLGVGHLVVVDPERIDSTNNPRVVGTRPNDLKPWLRFRLLAGLFGRRPSFKVAIAERIARDANPEIRYEASESDVTDPRVAEQLFDCDAIFLAADSMQARLVTNAICHQFLIPTWQVGAKVVSNSAGKINDVFSVVRQLVPGQSCLWCNELIDRPRLAEEAVSLEQRAAQRYVQEVPNPSVITLNAVACSHAVDQYLFSILGLREESKDIYWHKFRPTDMSLTVEVPRSEPDCVECRGRLGAGNLKSLPTRAA